MTCRRGEPKVAIPIGRDPAKDVSWPSPFAGERLHREDGFRSRGAGNIAKGAQTVRTKHDEVVDLVIIDIIERQVEHTGRHRSQTLEYPSRSPLPPRFSKQGFKLSIHGPGNSKTAGPRKCTAFQNTDGPKPAPLKREDEARAQICSRDREHGPAFSQTSTEAGRKHTVRAPRVEATTRRGLKLNRAGHTLARSLRFQRADDRFDQFKERRSIRGFGVFWSRGSRRNFGCRFRNRGWRL